MIPNISALRHLCGLAFMATAWSAALAAPSFVKMQSSYNLNYPDGATITLGSTKSIRICFDAQINSAEWEIRKGTSVLASGTTGASTHSTKEEGLFTVAIDPQTLLTENLKEGILASGETITVHVGNVTDSEGTATDINADKSYVISTEPNFKNFYPQPSEKAPIPPLKKDAAMYVYMDAKCTSVICEVTQMGVTLGNAEFSSATPTTNPGIKKTDMPALIDKLGLQPGEVVFTIKEVHYQNPLNTAEILTMTEVSPEWNQNYAYYGESGKLESMTEPSKVYSWIPKGDNGNVFTFTFDRAVTGKEGMTPSAMLVLGNDMGGAGYGTRQIPLSFSDDRKILTVDARGIGLGAYDLVPEGFHDQNGNTVDPPTTIMLELINLFDENGLGFTFTLQDADGTAQIYTGSSWTHRYDYVDISYVTPVLRTAEFYAASAPEILKTTIDETTDTMALTVEGNGSFSKADVVFIYEDKSFATEDVESAEKMIVSIPEEVRTRGSEGLSITLDNVAYAYDDGYDHTIIPLVAGAIRQVETVTSMAEMLALDARTNVRLLLGDDGAKVTMNSMGYIFIEDATAALMINPETAPQFTQGTALSGQLTGTYMGGGLFDINETKSEFTTGTADVARGLEITADDITADLSNRLVTFSTPALTFEIVGELLVIDDGVQVVTDFLDTGFSFPNEILSATGILYFMANSPLPMLLLRSKEDVEGKSDDSGVDTCVVPIIDNTDIYTIQGTRVDNKTRLTPGIYILNGRRVLIVE